VKEIAARLVELVKTKRQVAEPGAAGDKDELLRRILAHLRVRTGHDFTSYKRSTVLRRILRRMQVTRRDVFEEYFSYLREAPEEAQALLSDLLISVTTFFRDARAFDALAKNVIPRLFQGEPAGPIRVWIAGCATGEEAYTTAILLLEEASRHEARPEIQIFATDMDSRALAIAREGRYPAAIEADLNEDRLRRFFQHDGEHYRVRREVRDIVLFANHSLLKDPPFSKLDLVCCRNLLIYLNRELQQQVLATLHYALADGGFLFLGSSESAEHPDHLFRAVDRDARIYQSSGQAERLPVLPRLLGLTGVIDRPGEHQVHATIRGARATHREALEELAPPSILVDESYRVLHLSESAGRYLQPPGGMLSSEITELVREEIKFELRSALHRAFERDEISLTRALPVKFNGAPHRVYIQVKPVSGGESGRDRRRALILFIEGEPESEGMIGSARVGPPSSETVHRLQQELELAHARLRTMREESEAANEELRAANEELQSINEEYRSTAEELETSKEELQSINEELQTVNSELKLKLDTVSRANSDLQNLMAASDFGTLFLDPGLRIKRFTPRLAEVFNITISDLGRSITDFTHQLNYDELAVDARKVLRDLMPIDREVPSLNHGWYLVRFRPYRTVDDKIDGVVITFVDISERRRAEDALRTSEERLRQELRLVELSRAPLFTWEFDGGRIREWNRGSEELYGYAKEEALGKVKSVLLKTTVQGSSLDGLKRELLERGTWKGVLGHRTKTGRALTVEGHAELLAIDGVRYVLESTQDVTESRAWEVRQRLLLGELTHRVKNVLAIVQAMVHQTWRTSGSRDDFSARLDGRLRALASSHNLLVESEWEGTDLRRLIESQLAGYANDRRVRFKGEPVILLADLATPFGILLHELTTNAVKYGALSVDRGHVELTWALSDGNEGRWLKFTWQEKDGPPVKKPSSNGFGTQLIRKGLPRAIISHEFRREGVSCEIEVPLTEPDANGSSRNSD
jgi:two-component system CheB/CheR fusion protein